MAAYASRTEAHRLVVVVQSAVRAYVARQVVREMRHNQTTRRWSRRLEDYFSRVETIRSTQRSSGMKRTLLPPRISYSADLLVPVILLQSVFRMRLARIRVNDVRTHMHLSPLPSRSMQLARMRKALIAPQRLAKTPAPAQNTLQPSSSVSQTPRALKARPPPKRSQQRALKRPPTAPVVAQTRSSALMTRRDAPRPLSRVRAPPQAPRQHDVRVLPPPRRESLPYNAGVPGDLAALRARTRAAEASASETARRAARSARNAARVQAETGETLAARDASLLNKASLWVDRARADAQKEMAREAGRWSVRHESAEALARSSRQRAELAVRVSRLERERELAESVAMDAEILSRTADSNERAVQMAAQLHSELLAAERAWAAERQAELETAMDVADAEGAALLDRRAKLRAAALSTQTSDPAALMLLAQAMPGVHFGTPVSKSGASKCGECGSPKEAVGIAATKTLPRRPFSALAALDAAGMSYAAEPAAPPPNGAPSPTRSVGDAATPSPTNLQRPPDHLSPELEARRMAIAELEQTLEADAAECERVAKEAAEREASLVASREAAAAAAREQAEARAAVESHQNKLAADRKRLESLEAAAEESSRAVADNAVELERLQTESAEVRQAAEARKEELARLQAELRELADAKLAAHRASLADAETAAAVKASEVRKERSEVVKAESFVAQLPPVGASAAPAHQPSTSPTSPVSPTSSLPIFGSPKTASRPGTAGSTARRSDRAPPGGSVDGLAGLPRPTSASGSVGRPLAVKDVAGSDVGGSPVGEDVSAGDCVASQTAELPPVGSTVATDGEVSGVATKAPSGVGVASPHGDGAVEQEAGNTTQSPLPIFGARLRKAPRPAATLAQPVYAPSV